MIHKRAEEFMREAAQYNGRSVFGASLTGCVPHQARHF